MLKWISGFNATNCTQTIMKHLYLDALIAIAPLFQDLLWLFNSLAAYAALSGAYGYAHSLIYAMNGNGT